jgi:hypothetical protein
MEKEVNKIFIFIAISSLLFLVPVYLSDTNLSKINLFSTDLNLENENQLDVQNHESDTFSSIIFFINFFPGVNRFEQSYQLLSRKPFLNQKTSIFRC